MSAACAPNAFWDADEWPEVHRILLAFFNGDESKIDTWVLTPNPLLGGITPGQMLWTGRGEKLLKCMRNWTEGNMP